MDHGHPLGFGSLLTPSAEAPDAVVARAVLSEELGFDLVTVQDHPYEPTSLDMWTLLSFVGAATSSIALAPNVVNVPLRPPAMLARAAATLDLLTGGRVALGLGAGALWDGIAAMGTPRRTQAEAVTALGEAVDVLLAMWDTEEPCDVRLTGASHALAGARPGPAPAHDIPLWLGGGGPQLLRLVGTAADGWLPAHTGLGPRAIAAGNAAIDAAARGAGRDPGDIVRLLNVAEPEAGGSAAWAQRLATLALDHGVSTFIVADDDPALLERFITEVAPEVLARVAAARA